MRPLEFRKHASIKFPLHRKLRRTDGVCLGLQCVAMDSAAARGLCCTCNYFIEKWNHLAEVTHGQRHVVVLGNRQQSDLMAELSAWIQTSPTKKVSLAVYQYLKAIRPEAPAMWTYTTTWTIA